MKSRTLRTSAIAAALMLSFTTVSLSTPAQAAMLTTQQLAAEAGLAGDRQALRDRLLRDDVKTELVALGVSPGSVEQRINQLSSAELAQLNTSLDSLPAGGDGLGTVAMVLLILILLEITGVIDIFPKI